MNDIGHDGPWELEWWSIYSANTLALDDYRDGPVFFIGDSAHIVPIFGVRGLNNGIADAQNIGWKLALVLSGQAREALLDSYTPERRGATLDVFANATRSARFMTPPSHGWSIMRDAALSLALTEPWAGELANPRQMAPYIYDQSPLSMQSTKDSLAGPRIGAMMSEVALDGAYLTDRMGPDFTLIWFGDAPNIDHPLLRVISLPADGAAAASWDAHAGSAWLIRPDLHVAARWAHATPQKALDFLNAILEGAA